MVNIRYGTKELVFALQGGETYGDLKEKLEQVYDMEVPDNVEVSVGGARVCMSNEVPAETSVVEFVAQAGKKGK